MDKIIVLAPPKNRQHPVPPPALQQTHFPRNERLLLLSKKETYARICNKQAQQTSGSYTTLEQSQTKKVELHSSYVTRLSI